MRRLAAAVIDDYEDAMVPDSLAHADFDVGRQFIFEKRDDARDVLKVVCKRVAQCGRIEQSTDVGESSFANVSVDRCCLAVKPAIRLAIGEEGNGVWGCSRELFC